MSYNEQDALREQETAIAEAIETHNGEELRKLAHIVYATDEERGWELLVAANEMEREYDPTEAHERHMEEMERLEELNMDRHD